MQDFVELVSKHISRIISIEDSHNSQILFVEKLCGNHFILLTREKVEIDDKDLLVFLIDSVKPERV